MNPSDYSKLQTDFFSASINYSRATQIAEEVDDYEGEDQVQFATEALEETNKVCNQFKIIESNVVRMMDELSPNHSIYKILQDLLIDVQKRIHWSSMVLQRYRNLIANSDLLGSFAEGMEFKTKYGHIPQEILDRLAGLDGDSLEQVLSILNGEDVEIDEGETEEESEQEEPEEEASEKEEQSEDENYEPEIREVDPEDGIPLDTTDPWTYFGNVDRHTLPDDVMTWVDPKQVDESEMLGGTQPEEETEEESEQEEPEEEESEEEVETSTPEGMMPCPNCKGLFDPKKDGIGKIGDYYVCANCYRELSAIPDESEPEPEPKKKIVRRRTTKKKTAPKKKIVRRRTTKKEDSE